MNIKNAILITLLALTVSSCDIGKSIWQAAGMSEPEYDATPPILPNELGPEPRILVFSKTNGFRHNEAIEAANASLERIAKKRGWTLYKTENGAVFNAEQLALFDVVVGNNSTGDNWNEDQRKAFRAYIEQGIGGFLGIHGAAGTRFNFWDWYKNDLLKVNYLGHPVSPHIQTAKLVVEISDHPAMRHFPAEFELEDEWYSFKESPRKHGVSVLANLREDTYLAKALWQDLSMGEDHPIIWSHCFDSGARIFYSALGHSGETYERPDHEQMLEGALSWAMGLEGQCP